jgi:outer membrane autotransporter protein
MKAQTKNTIEARYGPKNGIYPLVASRYPVPAGVKRLDSFAHGYCDNSTNQVDKSHASETYKVLLALCHIVALLVGIVPVVEAQSVSIGLGLFSSKGCGNSGCHGSLSAVTNLRGIKSASNKPGAIATVLASTAAISQPMRDYFNGSDDAHTAPDVDQRKSLALYIGQFVLPTPTNPDSLALSGCNSGSFDVRTKLTVPGGTAPDSGGIVISQGTKGTANASFHTIAYTPGENFDAGGDTFKFTITNLAGISAEASVAVTVTGPPPTVTLGNQTPQLNQPFEVTISTANGPIRSYDNKDPLPPGLQLTSNKISGIPTTSGTFIVRLTATSCLGTGEKSVTFNVAPNVPPTIPTTSFEGTLGQPFSADIVPSSPPILAFSATDLPPGLSLNTSNDTTARIVGIPTQSGVFDAVTLTARNGVGTTNQPITITIFPKDPPAVSTDPTALAGIWNQPFKAKIVATNPPVTTYSGTTLPPGIVVNPSTGDITGTPSEPGEFKAKLAATNKAGTKEGEFTFVISAPRPEAKGISMTVKLNEPATLDLSELIFGHGVKGVTINSGNVPKHGAVTVSGTKITYTPVRNYFGSDLFAFTAIGTGGTSDAATVNVTVEGRPDPSQDPAVVGLVGAQVDAARRFSRTQISNFQKRLESLHRHESLDTEASPASLTKPGLALRSGQASLEPPPGHNASVPSAHMPTDLIADDVGISNPNLDKRSLIGLVGQSVETALTDVAPSSRYHGLLSSILSMSQSRTFNLASLRTNRAVSTDTGIWMAGNVGFGDRDASGSQSGTRFRTSGISIGIDRKYNDNLALGVGVGYARDRTDIGADGSESRARSTTLSLYGSYQPRNRNIFLDGLIGYGVLDYDTQRFVEPLTEVNQDPDVQPTKHFARASRDGNQLFGSIAVGYQSPLNSGFLWSPYARLDFSRSELNQASETGAGQYALTYFKQSVTEADLSLGLRAQWEHELNRGGVALPYARLEYTRNLKGDGRATVAYTDLVDGPRYSVPSVGGDRDALTLGVGSDFVLCNGASFGIDYQFRHSSGQENSQALQFRLAKALGAPVRSCKASEDAAPPNLHITVDAGITYDDNVTKAREGAGQLSDESFSLKGTKELKLFKFGRFGLVVSGSLGGEAFRHYGDLGHVFGEVQGELRYPAYSPNIALFVRSGLDHYKSHIRSGHNYSVGMVLQRNFIQHGIGVTAQIAHNARYSDSSVFDLSDNSAQFGISYSLNKDLSTGKADVLYLSGEFRRGDVVSTERESLANLNIADVFVSDDAFGRADLFSYRFDARTTALNVGYIKPLGSGRLDLSWTHVRSTSTDSGFAGASSGRYVDNQIKLVYVLHFGTWNRMGRFRAY